MTFDERADNATCGEKDFDRVGDFLSVVVPVRNRADIVGRTLDSIGRQSVQPKMIILVDNGSTDSTLAVLQSWGAGRGNVVVISEPAPGAAAARNAGLALVDTPYVMFFDSDDVMPVRHIEQVSRAICEAGFPDVVEFASELISPDGRSRIAPLRSGDYLANHIFHATMATQRFAVRTDFLRSVGGWNANLLAWNDLELGVRLLAASPRLAQIELLEPVKVHLMAESITGTDFSSKAGVWEQALDSCEQALAKYPRHRRLINYRRAILAGDYRRERHPELAGGLARGVWMKLIAAYVSIGGRGVSKLAVVEKLR